MSDYGDQVISLPEEPAIGTIVTHWTLHAYSIVQHRWTYDGLFSANGWKHEERRLLGDREIWRTIHPGRAAEMIRKVSK